MKQFAKHSTYYCHYNIDQKPEYDERLAYLPQLKEHLRFNSKNLTTPSIGVFIISIVMVKTNIHEVVCIDVEHFYVVGAECFPGT